MERCGTFVVVHVSRRRPGANEFEQQMKPTGIQ